MKLPLQLKEKIINFLMSLPNIHDSESQRAFILRAGLEPQLQYQIPFGKSPVNFVPLLVLILIDYGILDDGRNALEAVLKIAKSHVGRDKREYCDTLLQELRPYIEGQPSLFPSISYSMTPPKSIKIIILRETENLFLQKEEQLDNTLLFMEVNRRERLKIEALIEELSYMRYDIRTFINALPRYPDLDLDKELKSSLEKIEKLNRDFFHYLGSVLDDELECLLTEFRKEFKRDCWCRVAVYTRKIIPLLLNSKTAFITVTIISFALYMSRVPPGIILIILLLLPVIVIVISYKSYRKKVYTTLSVMNATQNGLAESYISLLDLIAKFSLLATVFSLLSKSKNRKGK